MKRGTLVHVMGAIVAVLGLTACGLHQDPLADADARFKNGRPTPTKPIFEKPIDSDAIVPSVPEFVEMEEERASEVNISARVLLPDYRAEIQIENLKELPGAVFDAAAGKLTWTPPRGFVSTAGGGNTVKRRLVVKITAKKPNEPVLQKTREMSVRVSREFVAPTITQVRKDSMTLREGNSMHLYVTVKDIDALDGDKNTWPDIIFTRVANRRGLVGWIEPYDVSLEGKNTYLFDFRVDLSDAELTASGLDFVTGIVAVSKYGKRSAEEQFSLTVFTSLSEPVTNWTNTQVFKAGERKIYQFLIYDPKQEAVLRLDRFRDTPDGASVDCQNSGASSALVCTIDWTPKPDQAGRQSYIITQIESRNVDGRDRGAPMRSLYLSYRVDPANFIPGKE